MKKSVQILGYLGLTVSFVSFVEIQDYVQRKELEKLQGNPISEAIKKTKQKMR